MIRAWTDGACEGNPGPCAYGVLIIDEKGKHHVLGKHLGQGTNNIAEYNGMLATLRWLVEHAPGERATISTDAQLVAYRLNGRWKKRRSQHAHIQRFIDEALDLLRLLPLVRIEWVPREQNQAADEISRRYLAREIR